MEIISYVKFAKDAVDIQSDYPFYQETEGAKCFHATPYTVENIRRYYGKITGNQLPVHFPFFYRRP